MLTSFYLFIIPLVGTLLYVAYKFVMHKEEIKKMETNAFLNLDEIPNNLDKTRDIVLDTLFSWRIGFAKNLTVFFHWLLHFIVIFLKFISDLTDILYIRSRDFFMKTVTKEKKAVTTFWHHLKEYKKEKEEERKEEEK